MFFINQRKSFGFSLQNIDLWLMGFVFFLLFLMPVIFTRVEDIISWKNVLKIWQDRILLIPLFFLNHWLLVPKLILPRKYPAYIGLVSALIVAITVLYYFQDEVRNPKAPKQQVPVEEIQDDRPDRKLPAPVPPYADLLMFSLLIVSLDTGLFLSKNWHRNEEDKIRLEQENTRIQLTSLRSQVSPHFFMNTLNNIYALIETNPNHAKQSMMKLSKLMRYLLYENKDGKVKISREFEFIRSYVDLMRLRYSDDIIIHLELPEKFTDSEIPAMLFISYLENAFKYGTSYEQKSLIRITAEIINNRLIFTCVNAIHSAGNNEHEGGLGMKNSKQRLDLLYPGNYSLNVLQAGKIFTVELNIPLV